MLKARGGKVEGGQRAIAETAGLSKGTFRRTLKALADAGSVVVEATKSGTTVRLASA